MEDNLCFRRKKIDIDDFMSLIYRLCMASSCGQLPVYMIKFINTFISVLPKGRSFTANSGTKAAILPKGRCFTTNSETKVVVLLGINRCVTTHCFLYPTLSLASEHTLKDLRGTNMDVRRVDLANWALWTSMKFTTEVKYLFIVGR